jgi:hypothetical protein
LTVLKRFAFTFVLAAILPAAAFATDNKTLKFDDIRSQQAEIRAGVEAKTGLYKDMEYQTRSELMRRQSEVLAIIEGKQVPDDLNADQRTRVFNDLEWIEAAINRTEDERLICEYKRTIGSNRKQRVCRTAAQIREDQERSKAELDSLQHQSGRR